MKVRKLTSGPVIKGVTTDEKYIFKVWGRGKKHNYKKCYLVLRYKQDKQDEHDIYSKPLFMNVDKNTDYIGMFKLKHIYGVTEYIRYYQIGYIHTNYLNKDCVDWSAINDNIYNMKYDTIETTFVFGSCRRYVKIGPFTLFGTGKSGDNIYGVIKNQNIDFFLSIGDQVYFDPMKSFLRIKSLNGMRKLYRKVRGFKHINDLMRSVPTYEICDDHDLHRDNTNNEIRENEPTVYKNGVKTYYEYQHYDGPRSTKPLWYAFEKDNCGFFVFDVRYERYENDEMIVSETQLEAFENWISNNNSKIKFVVSPVSIISQPQDDSWAGFPKQQKRVVEAILKYKNVYILVGDAHCARLASYDVFDSTEHKGTVTEIVSSGLVAINHDLGREFSGKKIYNIDEYDEENSFPYEIDNTIYKGLKFKTKFASKCYPYPNKPTGIKLLCHIFKRVIDNVFVKIKVKNTNLEVTIYNQDGDIMEIINI